MLGLALLVRDLLVLVVHIRLLHQTAVCVTNQYFWQLGGRVSLAYEHLLPTSTKAAQPHCTRTGLL